MAIKDLLVRMRLENSQFRAGMKQGISDLDGLAQKASSLSGIMAAAGVAGLAFLGKQALSAAWDLGTLGAQVERTETAFNELARQAGGSGDAISSAIKRASGNTVNEMAAMQAANRGLLLGLGANAEQWEQLTEVARFRGRAMGRTVTEALDDITMGIGRESRMILDNLGIILDLDAVMAEYAQSTGRATEQLSAMERKQAILNSVIRDGQAQIAAAGGIVDDAADSFERLDASTKNLKDSLGRGLAPAAADTATALYALSEAAQGNLAPFREMNALADLANMKIDEQGRVFVRAASGAWIFNEALTASEKAIRDSKNEADGWLGTWRNWPGVAASAKAATYALGSAAAWTADQYKEMANQAARMRDVRIWSAGPEDRLAAEQRKEAMYEGLDIYAEVAKQKIGIAEDEVARERQLAEDQAHAWESSYRDQVDAARQAYDDLRSIIEAALQPTEVTAEDMGLSAIGQYVEKWDESARQLAAIAQRGFAELQAHPDWAAILKIPPEVLAGGEEALKSWASRTANDVENLFRPDLLNIDAAIKAVEDYMRQQAARKISIDIIAQAMVEKGLLTPEGARQQVGQALGLDQGLAGEDAATTMMKGFSDSLADTDPAVKFAAHLKKNVTDKADDLKGSGEALWKMAELGIWKAMNESDYITAFAGRVAPEVAKILAAWGKWQGQD